MVGPSSPSPRTPERPTLLVERWRPSSLSEIVGQPEAVSKLRRFGESWSATSQPPKIRAALLEGLPGTGKTSAARALASEFGWGLVEMGASDARNRESLMQVAGRASMTNTFTEDGRYLSSTEGGRNLVLLDDADGINARAAAGEESVPRFAKAPPSFCEFLKGRYREVAALNQAWGLKAGEEPGPYASFDDLPAGGPRGNLAKREAVQRDVRDWQPSVRPRDLSDRGGLATVADLIRHTRQPIVLTAIDPRALSRASVVFRTGVLRVKFYRLREETIRSHLHRVSAAEHLGVPELSINTIVKAAKGDLRAAINDLELASTLHQLKAQGKMPASVEADEVLGWRDVGQNIFEGVDRILTASRFFRTREVLDGMGTSPDDLLLWIEENIPHFARRREELAAAFEALSHGQLHLARANRWRIWTLWSYATEVMTGGVSLELNPQGPLPPSAHPNIQFPRFLAEMGSSRGQRANRDSLASKAGAYTHMSRRHARDIMLPFLEQLFREGPGAGPAAPMEGYHREIVRVARTLGLEAREIAFLLQVEEDHPSVQALLREERAGRPAAPPSPEPPSEAPQSSPAEPTEGTKKASRRGQRTLDSI